MILKQYILPLALCATLSANQLDGAVKNLLNLFQNANRILGRNHVLSNASSATTGRRSNASSNNSSENQLAKSGSLASLHNANGQISTKPIELFSSRPTEFEGGTGGAPVPKNRQQSIEGQDLILGGKPKLPDAPYLQPAARPDRLRDHMIGLLEAMIAKEVNDNGSLCCSLC